jgi:FtsP/CotA-like multicopper oxidase with cupredoxin domain
MPKPRAVSSWRHGNAERYEVLIDFRAYRPGTVIDLQNLSNANNRDYDHTGKILRFVVAADGELPPDRAGSKTISGVPGTLVTSEAMSLKASDAVRTTKLRVERNNGTWMINGKSWHDVEDSDLRMVLANPAPDDVEIWEIENKSGGWFHPVHIHLVDFQVIGRNTNGGKPYDWELGPKDVIYVGENETVRLLMKFTLQKGGGATLNKGGRYMVHCHNLPHEDHDMMQQFSVGLAKQQVDPNDPIDGDPCKLDDDHSA